MKNFNELKISSEAVSKKVEELKTLPIIENWFIVSKPDPYIPPEYMKKYISGEVYNDPRFEDGKSITTSSIQKVEDNKVYTKNSVYILGEVNPDYEKAYPNAWKRLFNET